MTKAVGKIIIAGSMFALSAANAAVCGVVGATVTEVAQWDDGYIFVNLNMATDCACSHNHRVAFHKDTNEKFIMAQVLSAVATGKPIWVRAEDAGCVVHGNTARLLGFGIRN